MTEDNRPNCTLGSFGRSKSIENVRSFSNRAFGSIGIFMDFSASPGSKDSVPWELM